MRSLPSVIVLMILALSLTASAQQKKKTDDPSWIAHVPVAKVIEWRRHIHQNPELSFEEFNTSKYVEDVLKSFGNIDVVRPAKTSVIGILRGAKKGKTVAFRADMDALPIQEATGLPFSSRVENVSHACGHDAHSAMLLGTAATLSKMANEINGTVYFIFQHAEETPPGGALEIIKSGALNEVEAFFGMHVAPSHPVGHVGVTFDNPASTASDRFTLTITGKGTHGSMPHLGIDPIVIGAELVSALQTVVSRNVTPGEMAVISVGKFQAGNAPNVIADKAELAATVRTKSASTRQLVEKRIKGLIDHIVKAYGGTYELDYTLGYPSIENDPGLNRLAKQSAGRILGQERVFEPPAMTASEDFAYYKEVAPISMLTLGVGEGPSNHNPGFNLDEGALEQGVKAQVQILLDYLKDK